MSLMEIGFFVGVYLCLMFVGYRYLNGHKQKEQQENSYLDTMANQPFANENRTMPPLGAGIGKISSAQNYIKLSSGKRAG